MKQKNLVCVMAMLLAGTSPILSLEWPIFWGKSQVDRVGEGKSGATPRRRKTQGNAHQERQKAKGKSLLQQGFSFYLCQTP